MFKGEPSKDEYAVFTRENILQTKRNMKKIKETNSRLYIICKDNGK